MNDLTSFYAEPAVRTAAFISLRRQFDCARLAENAQSLVDHPLAFRRLMIQFAEQTGVDVSKYTVFQGRTPATITEILAMPAFLARVAHEAVTNYEGVQTFEAAEDDEAVGLGSRVIVFISSEEVGNGSRKVRRTSRQGSVSRRFHRAARFAGAR
jgi:hypothetical protein